MTAVLGYVFFGFIVGVIARAVTPGDDSMGFVGTTVLGILGAALGGWLGRLMGLYQGGEGAGYLAATLGAVIVLFVSNRIARSRRGKARALKDRSASRQRPAA